MHSLHTFKVHAKDSREAMRITEGYLEDIAEAAAADIQKDEDGNEYEGCPGFDYYSVIGALDIKTEIREATQDPLAGIGRGPTWLAIYGSKEGLEGVYEGKLTWKQITDSHTTLYRDDYMENGLTKINTDKEHPTTHIVLVDFHL